MLLFTSDHGEELDEHGCWFDHHGLYDTNTRIPLIVRLPGVVPEHTQVRGMTQMMDVVPTVLEYAGLLDEHPPFDGASLRPLIEAGGDGAELGTCEAVHMTENTWMKKRAVRTSRWKLIRALEPDLHGFPPVELYHVAADPAEARNVAHMYPDVVGELREAMEAHVVARTARTGLPDPLPLQPVPLKRVGRIEESDPAKAAESPAGDEKLTDGDFVGYVRNER
jgi:arylsulfatase A-like enzyme